MREILFRGKKALTGEWIEGSLIIDERSNYYIGKAIMPKPSEVFSIESARRNGKTINRFIGIGFAMVIPETVGQYTGVTDKNGKKIFEGDVVDFYFFDKGSKNTKTMLIEWRDEGFGMRELFRDYRLADDFSIIKEKIFTYRGDIRNGVYKSNNTYFIEVIGKIHDNPELLERSENGK